jgi:hypothetical protein
MEKKRSNKIHNYLAASPVTPGESINQAFKPKEITRQTPERPISRKQTNAAAEPRDPKQKPNCTAITAKSQPIDFTGAKTPDILPEFQEHF